jgi:parallel beta-helix repeat protein
MLEYLTVQGPSGTVNNGGSLYGIKIDGGGSATVQFNHITGIEDSPFDGVQEGVAIDVGRQATGQTGSATIYMNTIDNYQKDGILVDNVGSHATILNNTVIGAGPTPLIAQNGIQVSRGATATVDYNTVSGNVYSPGTDEATGILLYNAGVVDVEGNTTFSNDVGIYDFGGVAGSQISCNTVTQSTFEGIVLDGTNNTLVQGNQISYVGTDGISLLNNSFKNTIQDNTVSFSGHDGIVVDAGSTMNQFLTNNLSGSGNLDAVDLSGDGNTWIGNTGTTSSPTGLVSGKK